MKKKTKEKEGGREKVSSGRGARAGDDDEEDDGDDGAHHRLYSDWQCRWAPGAEVPGGSQSAQEEQMVEDVLALFPEAGAIDCAEVSALVAEAVAHNDRKRGAETAVRWAGDFSRNPSWVAADEEELAMHGGDLEAMVLARQELKATEGRPSLRSIADTLSVDNPERAKLQKLVGGMPVPTARDFQPNGAVHQPGRMTRKSYTQAEPAVDKMLAGWHQKKLAVILTYATAKKIPGIHFSPPSWTTNAGKDSGRAINDFTDDTFGSSLNSEEVADMARAEWGEIHHPTSEEIVCMIYEFYYAQKAIDPRLEWDVLVLFKLDLTGAYTLLFFRARDTALLALELLCGLVLILFGGAFGWVVTPFCFDVITRAIVFEMKMRGGGKMYVDDVIVVTLRRWLVEDMKTARGICTGLLGPAAIAEEKVEWGTDLDVLGWHISLSKLLLGLARKNYLNALHSFFTIGADGTFTVPEMERLASLSCRYSMVYRQAGPFSSALYAATQGLKNRRARHKLQPATAMAFDLWKLVLVAGGLRPDVMNRPLASFVLKPSRIFMVTDAALQGGGAVFYNKLALTTYTEQVTLGFLGGVAVSLSSLCFGEDSSYQNCAEFITKVVGLLGLAKLGVRDQTLHVIGDDMSALSWARKGRTRSALARDAVLVFVTVALELGLTIDGTDHL
jgi:hypothetical protein